MKKAALTLLMAILTNFSFAQTAVDFNANDCNGNSYNLFNELNTGKVIVICWVMPCGACAVPAQTSFNMVQGYQASHPGVVQFYLCDDYANSSCTTINNWATSLGISNTSWSHYFSSSSINMLDYGSTGMPKTVVLGGASHTVFYNVNNTINSTNLQNAINAALSTTGIQPLANNNFDIQIAPNPVSTNLNVKILLEKKSDMLIELYTVDGKLIKQLFEGEMISGNNQIVADLSDCNNGVYLLKVSGSGILNYQNLVIAR